MSRFDSTNVNFKVYNKGNIGVERRPVKEGSSPDWRIMDSDIHLLQRCKVYWDALYDLRERRRRNRMYHRGDQWKDKVFDAKRNKWVTEEEYIRSQGKMPLKQNQIRQLMKNIIGQFLADQNKAAVISRNREDATVGEMLTNTLQYALELNQARKIDTRMFEEFMLSGVGFQKTRYRYFPKLNRDDLFIENRYVPNMFFNDNIKDVRLVDMDLIGEFYDLPEEKVIAVFAKNEEDANKIRQIYSGVLNRKDSIVSTGSIGTPEGVDGLDFYNPIEPHLCRVFEIWQKLTEQRYRCHDWLNARRFTATLDRKKDIEAINARRIAAAAAQGVPADKVPLIEYEVRAEEFWYVKFLSPWGHCLYESETLYEHKEHPYTLLLYPLIDGEIWGFVEDIIDQQRYVNRLIMLMDFVIGASAKGVLLVPEEAIPDDMDIDDIAEEWSKFDGVIKLKLKHGVQIPQQISSSASIPGVNELLALQLKFMTDISGVSPSIQGQRAPSGTPAQLYAQETQNASLNVRDYFEAFNAFLKERNWKALKTIIQFYDEERKIALAGSNYTQEALIYNPQKAKDAEVDVIMTQTPDSPAYRGIIESSLQTFLGNQLIDLELYLQNSTLPFADKLLSDIRLRKEQMAKTGVVDPALVNQLGAGLQSQGADASAANPQTMALMEQYMAGALG